MDFPGGSDGKASAYNAGDLGSVPGSGRSPEEGNGIRLRGWQSVNRLDNITDAMDLNLNKFQEMVKDREAWHAVVIGLAESDTT